MGKIREYIMTKRRASSCSMPEFHVKKLQRDHPDPNAIPLTLGMVTACKAVSRWAAKVEEEERNGQGSGRQLKLWLHKS
jgi:hypothetical protein